MTTNDDIKTFNRMFDAIKERNPALILDAEKINDKTTRYSFKFWHGLANQNFDNAEKIESIISYNDGLKRMQFEFYNGSCTVCFSKAKVEMPYITMYGDGGEYIGLILF